MARLHIFTVHINPSLSHAHESAQFVLEGFSWKAFFFTALWAFYHHLWIRGIIVGLTQFLLFVSWQGHMLSFFSYCVLQLGFQVLIGLSATDWVRARLKRQGYLLDDITAGDSLLRAEQRYFDRYLAEHPTVAA